jgi:hypothetical protein
LTATLEAVWQPTGRPKSDFLIVIRTDCGSQEMPASDSPLTMDRRLAGRLVTHLGQAGYTRSVIIDGDAGVGGSILFDFGGIVRNHPIATEWHAADFRISFPKCRTNASCFYTACLSNCRFPKVTTPMVRYPNGHRIANEELCILMADRLPVHYGFLDAWMSGDGPQGVHPNPTHTLFAARNILALDWVAGEKMNLDPAFNPVIQEALHRWGTVAIDRRGNQTPWSPWKNASRLAVVLSGITEK